MGRLVGYARVSTTEQKLDLQLDALAKAGVSQELVFTDQASGARDDRLGLALAMAAVEPGDTLVVWRLDRLGRSVPHLAGTVGQLSRRGVAFRSLTESLDTSSAAGRFVVHTLAAVAELERDLARERIRAGMDASKRRGKHIGRPITVTVTDIELARRLMAEGQSVRSVCRTLKTTPASLYRALERYPKSLESPDGFGERLVAMKGSIPASSIKVD